MTADKTRERQGPEIVGNGEKSLPLTVVVVGDLEKFARMPASGLDQQKTFSARFQSQGEISIRLTALSLDSSSTQYQYLPFP